MERLIYETKFSKIKIYSELDGLEKSMQQYIYSYANLSESKEEELNVDASIYIFKTEDNKKNRNIRINSERNEIGILLENLNRDNQLYIKRLLINLNNRILESKGVIFIHASSVCYNNEGIMFVGNRGNGKTTNMMYMLENSGVQYVSNDRTGIKVDSATGEIIMIGIPSRINVRPGTIESNQELKNSLMPILEQKNYDKMLEDKENTSMKSRMTFSIQELKDYMGIEEKDVCRLHSIILLDYNSEIEYESEQLTYEEIIQLLEQQRISGVFSGTKEIENTIEVDNILVKDIIKDKKLNCVKVTQNCNNSEKILKELFKVKGENSYDRE